MPQPHRQTITHVSDISCHGDGGCDCADTEECEAAISVYVYHSMDFCLFAHAHCSDLNHFTGVGAVLVQLFSMMMSSTLSSPSSPSRTTSGVREVSHVCPLCAHTQGMAWHVCSSTCHSWSLACCLQCVCVQLHMPLMVTGMLPAVCVCTTACTTHGHWHVACSVCVRNCTCHSWSLACCLQCVCVQLHMPLMVTGMLPAVCVCATACTTHGHWHVACSVCVCSCTCHSWSLACCLQCVCVCNCMYHSWSLAYCLQCVCVCATARATHGHWHVACSVCVHNCMYHSWSLACCLQCVCVQLHVPLMVTGMLPAVCVCATAHATRGHWLVACSVCAVAESGKELVEVGQSLALLWSVHFI